MSQAQQQRKEPELKEVYEVGQAKVAVYDDGTVLVYTPYSEPFIEELKHSVRSAKWNVLQRAWVANAKELPEILRLVRRYFDPGEVYAEVGGVQFRKTDTKIEVPYTLGRCSRP